MPFNTYDGAFQSINQSKNSSTKQLSEWSVQSIITGQIYGCLLLRPYLRSAFTVKTHERPSSPLFCSISTVSRQEKIAPAHVSWIEYLWGEEPYSYLQWLALNTNIAFVWHDFFLWDSGDTISFSKGAINIKNRSKRSWIIQVVTKKNIVMVQWRKRDVCKNIYIIKTRVTGCWWGVNLLDTISADSNDP